MPQCVRIIDNCVEMLSCTRDARRAGRVVGLVPTMGALHDGHLSLIRAARNETNFVVVSIFVNPTQFGPNEDLDRYPRMREQDRKLAAEAGADVTFEPQPAEMYPEGYATYVYQESLAGRLEGEKRPNHFRGVCTVCTKLFNVVEPDIAYFGQKDYQQSVIVRRIVRDLNMPLEIKILPTVRERDGLAMSSRNTYLNPQERQQATCLSRALSLAQQRVSRGETESPKVLAAMLEEIEKEPLSRIDYAEIVHPDTLEPVNQVETGSVALLAVHIGGTRLIDNAILRL